MPGRVHIRQITIKYTVLCRPKLTQLVVPQGNASPNIRNLGVVKLFSCPRPDDQRKRKVMFSGLEVGLTVLAAVRQRREMTHGYWVYIVYCRPGFSS